MDRSSQAWREFAATRVCGAAVDVAVLAVAYCASILLRFDLHVPRWGWSTMAASFVTVAAAHLAALALTGCYRLAWRRTRLGDLPRYVAATSLACVALTALRVLLPVESYTHVRPPYTVTLISFFLSTAALVGWRIVWSWFWEARRSEYGPMGRKARSVDSRGSMGFFRGCTVMVTGAGGSIGSEIVRQVAGLCPARILLVERGENALYEIDREMRARSCGAELVPLMKDINDVAAMEAIFAAHKPDVVLHAAAYKHVPMVEMNPDEGWRNNTEGTRGVAELALKHGTRRFVLISTDKAVNPVSVMGRTKLAAEHVVMELNGRGATSFCAVRFGNVFGSSGSVVPLFREQIAKRLPITVTHPDMKRYFMTVQEAVWLVLQAASRSERAIYTLDMGEPVRILDLAESLVRQAGYRPYVDIPIVFTGVRPGEKLFEELDVSEKSCVGTDMAKIYITKQEPSGKDATQGVH